MRLFFILAQYTQKNMMSRLSALLVLCILIQFTVPLQGTSEDIPIPTVEPFYSYTDAVLFTSPDSSYHTLFEFLNQTRSELLVASYQFNCQYISERIAELAVDGIEVTVLVDGEPVGGLSGSTLSSLTRIQRAGGSVNVISSFVHFHGKYIVRDGTHLLMTSENFGQNGFSMEPSYGNRGWGIVVNCTSLAGHYRDLYMHDLGYSEPITPDVNLEPYEPETGYYHPRFNSKTVHGLFRITPVQAPETSHMLLDMIRDAEHTIYVQQYYIRDWGNEQNPIVVELKEAAHRGVRVSIQMDSTWFNRNQNGKMADSINRYAQEHDLDMEARLMEYRQGFQSVHNKGMIVDSSRVLISSINWNENSYSNNRETALIVENREVGEYFSNVFNYDWKTLKNRPVADAGIDREVTVGEVFVLDGTYSWEQRNITAYEWDLNGNGVFDRDGDVIHWTFQQPGTYRITLRVTDREGATDSDSVFIHVTDVKVHQERGSFYPILLLIPLLIFFVWLSKGVAET